MNTTLEQARAMVLELLAEAEEPVGISHEARTRAGDGWVFVYNTVRSIES